MKSHDINERFWAKVRKTDGCWLRGSGPGYGQFWDGTRLRYAHRVAWEIVNGPIPDRMLVCHKCDTQNCVNPAHLFLGTQLDNMRDMIKKGRDNKRGRNMKLFSLYVTEQQLTALRKLSKRLDLRMAEIVRRALDAILKESK